MTYKESLVEQVIPDTKKLVKTEKIIGKTVKELRDKPKKGSLIETKTLIAFTKGAHGQKNKEILPDIKSSLNRSTSSQNKKQAPKFFAPPTGKKSRF